jgi:hypothetical protein
MRAPDFSPAGARHEHDNLREMLYLPNMIILFA